MAAEQDTVQNCPAELQGGFRENRHSAIRMNDRSRQIASGKLDL
jgi:hypothetical protein